MSVLINNDNVMHSIALIEKLNGVNNICSEIYYGLDGSNKLVYQYKNKPDYTKFILSSNNFKDVIEFRLVDSRNNLILKIPNRNAIVTHTSLHYSSIAYDLQYRYFSTELTKFLSNRNINIDALDTIIKTPFNKDNTVNYKINAVNYWYNKYYAEKYRGGIYLSDDNMVFFTFNKTTSSNLDPEISFNGKTDAEKSSLLLNSEHYNGIVIRREITTKINKLNVNTHKNFLESILADRRILKIEIK